MPTATSRKSNPLYYQPPPTSPRGETHSLPLPKWRGVDTVEASPLGRLEGLLKLPSHVGEGQGWGQYSEFQKSKNNQSDSPPLRTIWFFFSYNRWKSVSQFHFGINVTTTGRCKWNCTITSVSYPSLFHRRKKHLIIISPISPFCNMLNTWWLCVILNITQYHSISHAFCQQTINGLLSLLIGRVICCDIQYHTISRWVSDNWINRDIVILIS